MACARGTENEAASTGRVFRLPAVAEWKTIAQPGNGSREYPWEDDNVRFNYRTTDLQRPSPVGLFPPYCRPGLLDLGTNVFEWSRELSVGPGARQRVALLGGGWRSFRQHLRIARPPWFAQPSERRPDLGFRCVREERD